MPSTTVTLPEKLAAELQSEAQNRQLPLDELVADILASAFAQPGGPYHRALTAERPVPDSEEEIPEFWKMAYAVPIPEPPPPTPEGDRMALAALDELHGLFPIADPAVGRWIAESEEAAIYNAYLYAEESPETDE